MRWLRHLYAQVIVGVCSGILVGAMWPEFGIALKPLGDTFIRLIKMVIAPVVFCTVAAGIAHTADLRKVGRVGGKALIYFEVVSTIALLLGLFVGYVVQPGAGLGIDPAMLDPSATSEYVKRASESTGFLVFLLSIIPDNFVGAFANGDLLQVLFVAMLAGFAAVRLGPAGVRVAHALDQTVKVFFSAIHIMVRAAPIGAFGAMAFTVGRYGLDSLLQLFTLVVSLYATCLFFVVVVLGLIAWWVGFSLWKLLKYLREEILIVFGACSSEAALPQMMEKLERLGAAKSVVGLVVPTGYSFNLDGGNIYLTLSMLFLAQATGTDLSAWQVATIIGIALISSKGTAGVTGAGFITLAATMAVVPDIPYASLALLVGIDRFMAECRGVTNFIGNSVAGLAVARWDNQLDMERLHRELDRGPEYVEEARKREDMLPPEDPPIELDVQRV